MEGTRTILWLFLLLNQLLLCPTDADQGTSTTQTNTQTGDQNGSSVTATQTSLNTTDHTKCSGNCLIDNEMGLIAIGSAGGLIVCLLIATVVLACQVCQIQRRVSAPRTSRSNMDLVSSTSYWDNDRPEVRGLVGPCDASVMLEEVREESNMEEQRQAEMREVKEEAGKGLEEGATAMVFDPKEMAIQMQSSIPRDSCLVVPRDLEDMPLVV